MASQGGNLAVSLYEDVMRTMESALRQQPALAPLTPRGLQHTLVMEAIKPPPNSSATRVVEPDPENIRNSIPESDRGPSTLRRTTSITMASRQSMPTIADVQPDSERPESTILLVTIEELEAEAAGPITERIPQAVPDRSSGVQLVQQHASVPAPMMTTPAQAFAPVPLQPKKSSAVGIVLAILGVIALFAMIAAGVYVLRVRRPHVSHPVTAGIVAPPPVATDRAEPPPVVEAPPPKPEDGAASRVAVGPKKASSHKKTAKKSAPIATSENAAASNDDPATLLNKGLDPATEL